MKLEDLEREFNSRTRQTAWPMGRSQPTTRVTSQQFRNEHNCPCKDGTCADCVNAAYSEFYGM